MAFKSTQFQTNYPGYEPNQAILHDETIFLTEDIGKASYHAMNAVHRDVRSTGYGQTRGRVRGFPIIFRFEIPDPNLLVPDYDIENYSTQPTGTYQNVFRPKRRSGQPKVKEPAFDMSKKVGVFGYRGRIPASFIRQILIKTNTDDTSAFSQDTWLEATPAQLQQAIEYGEGEAAFWEIEEDEVCPVCGWVKNDSGECNCTDNPPEKEASYHFNYRSSDDSF